MPANITSTEIEAAIALLDSIQGTFVHRQGTVSEIDLIVLAAGELAFTTDTNEIRRGDGTTPGGVFVIGGCRRYAYQYTNPIDNDYIDAISVPVTTGFTYEFRATVSALNTTTELQAALVFGFYSLAAGVMVESNIPPGGPKAIVGRRLFRAINASPDQIYSYYAWNNALLLDLGYNSTTLEVTFGGQTAGTYTGIEYWGTVRIAGNTDLILRIKHPAGASANTVAIADLEIRRTN